VVTWSYVAETLQTHYFLTGIYIHNTIIISKYCPYFRSLYANKFDDEEEKHSVVISNLSVISLLI